MPHLRCRLTHVSKHHHDKTIPLVVGQMTFCPLFAYWQNPKELSKQSHQLSTFNTLLYIPWVHIKQKNFCFKDDLEFALTTTNNMACFIANFTLVLDFFTSFRDWIRPKRSYCSTTPCFKNLKCLRALKTTIGS